ncbi:MAG TPA: error-prone DNA polymerase [Rhodanobacteraceae bacterium]
MRKEKPAYTELHCLSDFSFGRGASSARELFERAKACGYHALAITDECSLAGIVRAHEAARDTGVPLIIGSEIQLIDGPKLVLLVENATGYTHLCELITRGRCASAKGSYRLTRADLASGLPGTFALWIPSYSTSGIVIHPPPSARSASPPPSARRGIEGDDSSAPASPRAARDPLPVEGGIEPEHGAWLRSIFGNRLWLAVELHRDGDDAAKLARLTALANDLGIPPVAAGDVHMHVRSRRALQDTLTAIRQHKTLIEARGSLFRNGERHLRRRDALAAIYPQALLDATLRIAERCTFSLDELHYRYPAELVPAGHTPTTWLRHLTEDGLRWRWPEGESAAVRAQVEHELELIAELQYEPYFLTVHDIVRFARSKGILCQGRGSAANSAVCFALGITAVDPARTNTLVERFISKERNEPPDIDIDFEHERREEVLQYIYQKYGRDRAALTAEVISYRGKSAVRDVAKALGLPPDAVNKLAFALGWWNGETPLDDRLIEAGFDPESPIIRRMLRLTRDLLKRPRHLSQHVGGFVISDAPLATLVPVENAAMPERTIIQWDKDDLDSLGLLKVDCLALGMLTCLRKCMDLLRQHHRRDLTLATIPAEDADTYAMLGRADSVGVFQIESRAQMAMLPRLKPRRFYDLVIEVAIVRPGPIQGDMIHPYLKRRNGEEPVTYPSADVQAVLERTLGVPLFQEQVMKLAIVAAGYTPGEADQLRRSMAAWRRHGDIEKHRARITQGMLARGYTLQFSEQLFDQLKGFGSYGFPESHAASFALLAYASAWLKCHEPAAFLCALLNSLPMGFYSASQLVQDARRHGVAVYPVDVRASDWDCTLEAAMAPPRDMSLTRHSGACTGAAGAGTRNPVLGNARIRKMDSGFRAARGPGMTSEKTVAAQPAIRLGFRQVRGFREGAAERIHAARAACAFTDLADLVERADLDARDRTLLAEAGALRGLAGHRHRAHWSVAGIEPQRPLFGFDSPTEATVALPPPTTWDDTRTDYATTGLTLGPHPVAQLRSPLRARRCRTSRELQVLRSGTRARAAGLVTLRQRPSTASGVTFVSLEDETGMVNVIVWRELAERQRRVLLTATLLGVDGRWESVDGVANLIADQLYDYSALLGALDSRSRDFH